MLSNLRISTRLLFVIGVFVVGVIAVAFMGLLTLRQNLVEDRMAKLHDVVLMARQAVELSQKQSADAGVPEKEAMEKAKAIVRSLRFGVDDYFVALDSQGNTIAHMNSKVEGNTTIDVKDADGVYYTRELMKQASQGGGFVSYRYPRGGVGEPAPKLSYGVTFKPWGWTILGGVFIDDIDAIFWS